MLVGRVPDHMPKRSSTERVSMVCILSTSIFNNECCGRKGMVEVVEVAEDEGVVGEQEAVYVGLFNWEGCLEDAGCC